MADQEENRSEQATPFRLRQARQRGQTARSQEAGFVAVLAALVLILYASAPEMARRILALSAATFAAAGQADWSEAGMLAWLGSLVLEVLRIIAPALLCIVLAVILANLAQVGPIFSFHPVKPDLARIGLKAGMKRLFSLQVLYAGLKSAAKLAVFGLVLLLAVEAAWKQLQAHALSPAAAIAAIGFGEAASLIVKLAAVGLVIMLVDLVQTRRKFAKDMRMSRREITEEHKRNEGDPRIRNRIRQLRAEFLKRTQSLRALPGADVVLMNPTHYAVAVSYKHGDMPAPKLLAKASGLMALRLRDKARRLHIPVVVQPQLARALFKRVDADQYLPEDLYPQMARILLWVYAMREQRSGGGGQ